MIYTSPAAIARPAKTDKPILIPSFSGSLNEMSAKNKRTDATKKTASPRNKYDFL